MFLFFYPTVFICFVQITRVDHVQPSRKSSSVSSGNGGINAKNNVVPGDYSRVQALRPGLRRTRLAWCSHLTYLKPPRYITALASFPGSGNTWLRYLLQQATGKPTYFARESNNRNVVCFRFLYRFGL